MKHIKITMALAVALAGFTSCDEDYDVTIPTPDVPYDAEMEAALSKYDVLTEYASKAGVPFGVSVSPEDFASKKLAYSIVATNYTQVEAPGLFTPAKLINEEGVLQFLLSLKPYIDRRRGRCVGVRPCSLLSEQSPCRLSQKAYRSYSDTL